MLNINNHNAIDNSEDLRSILGSLFYLKKEACHAQLESVQQILSEAIQKIIENSTTSLTINSLKQGNSIDDFIPLIEFFKLIQKLDIKDINEIVLAIASVKNKPH